MSSLNREEREFVKKGVADSEGFFLTVEEVATLCDFFQEKHGIKIVVNGETDFGQSEIAGKKQQIKESLATYEEVRQQFPILASYLLIYANEACLETMVYSTHSKGSGRVVSFARRMGVERLPELYGMYKARQYASLQEIEKGYRKIFETMEAEKESLDPLSFAGELQLYLEDPDVHRLYAADAIKEMQAIQRALPKGKAVGYAYTGTTLKKILRHVEVFVILPDKIIKPIPFNAEPCLTVCSDLFYSPMVPIGYNGSAFDAGAYAGAAILPPSLSSFKSELESTIRGRAKDMRESSWGPILLPQADGHRCGALGILYLVSLLKEGAKNLRENSMCFSFSQTTADSWGSSSAFHEVKKQERLNFWIPPHDVLLFSQSKSYNKFQAELVSHLAGNPVVVNKQGETYSFPSLRAMAMVAAIEGGVDLDSFCLGWTLANSQTKAKHARLQGTSYHEGSIELTKEEYLAKRKAGRKNLSPREGNLFLAFKTQALSRLAKRRLKWAEVAKKFSPRQLRARQLRVAIESVQQLKEKYKNPFLGNDAKRSVCKEFSHHLFAMLTDSNYDLKGHVDRLKVNKTRWNAATAGECSGVKSFFDRLEEDNYYQSSAPELESTATREGGGGCKPGGA